MTTATLSDSVEFSSDVRQIAANGDAERARRLASIKAQITDGSYDVDGKVGYVADVLARQLSNS